MIMAPDADFHSQPDSTHPNLLTIPEELKLQILSNFYDDDNDPDNDSYNYPKKDPSNALTLMVLRRTHKSLRQLIPNPWKEAQPTAKHYILAERRYPYLFPFACVCTRPSCYSDHCDFPCYLSFPCYDCLRVIKRGVWYAPPDDKPYNDNFKNFEVAYLRERGLKCWSSSREFIGGEYAQDRICDECWQRWLEAF